LSLVKKICQAIGLSGLFVLTASQLVSCASLPSKQDAEAAPQAAAEQPVFKQQNLPNVELTEDLLYKLLLSDIASQQRNNEIALSTLVDAATETRDPRLAAQATKQAVISARYGTAIQMARLWQELSPEDIDAYQTLGNLLVVKKETGEAATYYSKVLSLTDTSKHGTILEQISSTLVRYGSEEESMALIKQLEQDFPESAEVALARARIASNYKQYTVAEEAVDHALALDPGSSDAAVLKFTLLLLQKKKQEAEAFAQAHLKINRDDTALRTSLARHYLEDNKLKAADREYSIIYEQDETSIIAPMALGLIRMDAGEMNEAAGFLERVLELQPNNDMARIYLGDIANQQKRLDDAAQWYRAVTDSEQLFNARLRLVNVIRKKDGADAALRELEGIHPETPAQQTDIILLQNEILIESDRVEEALELINSSLEDSPEDIDLLYARAMIAARREDVAALEKDLLRILDIKPGHTQSLNALGFTLADLTERYEEAYSLISTALKQKPGDPFILDSMGWVEYRLGNLEEAEKYLRKALAKRNDPEIAAHLSEVLFVAGKKREARKVWQKAIKDFPDNEKLEKARIILEQGGVL
jgi:tetratricopeptide (TPR) repeat protein